MCQSEQLRNFHAPRYIDRIKQPPIKHSKSHKIKAVYISRINSASVLTTSHQGDIRHREANFLTMRTVAMADYCFYWPQHFCVDSHWLQTDCILRQKIAPQRTRGHGIQPAEMKGENRGRQLAPRCMFQRAMLEHRPPRDADLDLRTLTSILLQPSVQPQRYHHGLHDPTTN